jgi:hypothetical protein
LTVSTLPLSLEGRRAVPMMRRAAGAHKKQGVKMTVWQDSTENPAASIAAPVSRFG